MKVGFIGLGAMGSGMAANVIKGGHELIVNDVRKEAAGDLLERGARWAETASELAGESEVVFTSLPTPQDVESVMDGDGGLASGLRAGSAWFDLSTNSVDTVRRLQRRMSEQSVAFLDAPVSGGPWGAASGRLAIWVGGDREVFEHHADVLGVIGDQVSYVGPIGAGTIAKLAHNMASFAINAVAVEILTMGVKAGVEPAALWQAIRQGATGRTRTFDNLGRSILPGPPDPPNFQLRLAFKDAQLALQVGRDAGVPMALCELTVLSMIEAVNRGWGTRDSSAVHLLQQERAGLTPFAVPKEEISRILASDET